MSESNMQKMQSASDYTPTTEEIRLDYAPAKTFPADAEAQFDRWLAEVKAQAWEEGRYTQYREYPRPARRDNPYWQGEEQ